MNTEIILLSSFLVVSFLYSSVGHGGASGYLAIMVIFGIRPEIFKSSALVLNLLVSGISFYSFYKAGYFRWKLIRPFLITSMPAAFAGALFHPNPFIFKLLLGMFLLFATFRLFIHYRSNSGATTPVPVQIALLMGLIIGFISGLIGIGGGILLTPVLLICRYAHAREASAVSALFIFLNSLTGLIGIATTGLKFLPEFPLWLIVVVVGGILGSLSGSRHFSELNLKRILSLVLLFATLKLFIA